MGLCQTREQYRAAWDRLFSASKVFDGRASVCLPGNHPDEERFLTVALLDDHFVTVVWTQRGEAVRIHFGERVENE